MFSNHPLLKAALASIWQCIPYTRAPRGERAEVEERFETGSNISVVMRSPEHASQKRYKRKEPRI